MAELNTSDQLRKAREFVSSCFVDVLNTQKKNRIVHAYFVNSIAKRDVADVFKHITDIAKSVTLAVHLKTHGFMWAHKGSCDVHNKGAAL